jgi:hypothetical protein
MANHSSATVREHTPHAKPLSRTNTIVNALTRRAQSLTELICSVADEPGTRAVALRVPMATLENSTHPKALANTVKHFAFVQCGELNLYGRLDV